MAKSTSQILFDTILSVDDQLTLNSVVIDELIRGIDSVSGLMVLSAFQISLSF
jgi:hypothetical protein